VICSMKLGIFGDSYADCHTYETGWPNLLAKEISKQDDFKNYGVSGTSHWFSYQNFLENFHNYDTIVFCHTNSMRWPVTPPGEHRKAFNVGYFSCPIMDPFNKVRKDIMSEELLNYLSFNIFRDINRLCLEHNIYLVNILCFPLDFILPPTKFPVLIDLSEISRKEQVIYEGKLKFTVELNSLLRGDRRDCHLNTLNNKKLADIVTDLIKNKTYNIYKDLLQEYNWDYRDPAMDKIYEMESEYEKNLNNG